MFFLKRNKNIVLERDLILNKKFRLNFEAKLKKNKKKNILFLIINYNNASYPTFLLDISLCFK